MRVLFISRATLYSNSGGDTIQIINTAEELKKFGVHVEIRLANEKIDYSKFDLIHFFNIIRPADILYHIDKSHKPYVISTIFVDYYEYERKNSNGVRKLISGIFSPDGVEYLKVITRYIINNEKIVSPIYFLNGHRKSVQKVIAGAKTLLPNSENEYKRLANRYEINQKYKIIPNGIDENLFSNNEDVATLRENDLIICVARIEPLKNQLNLIKALNNTNYRLLIIGKPSTNQIKYYSKCRQQASSNIFFIDHIAQQDLIGYYRQAKVHVLPSWFETTGLSSLEAAAMGCNIVITDKGDTTEYFKDYAYYCQPQSPESILNAVKMASCDKVNKELELLVRNNYTWKIAGKKTFEAYKEIL